MPDKVAEVASGGIGGGVQGIVLSPLLLLKTRVMTDPSFRASGGMWATTVQASKVGVEVVKREGVAVLMKGSLVFTLKRVADWSTRYFFAETCREGFSAIKGAPLTKWQKAGADFTGGALSATVTIPIDVLVATIQDAGKAGQKVSVVEVWREKMKQGGVSQLLRYSTKGYVARVAHVALTTLLMKNVASVVYKWVG